MDMMLRPSAPAVISLGLAAMLLLTTAAGMGAAAAPNGSLLPQGVSNQPQRSIQVFTSPASHPQQFWINSVSIGAAATDEFQISYAKGSFTLQYERAAGGPVTSSFTVTIQGLSEWRDSGDGMYSDGTIVAYTPLGAAAFGNRTIVHTGTVSATGVTTHSFHIESNDGTIVMNLTVSQGFVQLSSGHILTPMEAELTLQVNHVMMMNDTNLALQVSMTTPQRPNMQNQSWDDEHDFAQNERAINVTNGSGGMSSSAYFAWSNEAIVNGQAGAVAASGPELNETSGAYDVYFSYPRVMSMMNPREMNVIHDPSIGVVSVAYESGPGGTINPAIQADLPLYAVSMAAVAALVGGTAVLADRRRREGR